MTIDEARKFFKERYTQAGLTLEEEHPDRLVLSRGQSKWIVDAPDLTEYVEQEARFAAFVTKPTECSITSKSYSEQALVGTSNFLSSPFIDKDTEIVFGDRESGAPFAVFARASAFFLAYFRFKPGFLEWTTRRLKDTLSTRRKQDSRVVDRMTPFPPTRVENIQAASVDESLKIANGIISGCLFQLAAARGLPHRARRNWPKQTALAQTQEKDEEQDGSLPLLKVNPIRDLVSLYTLGTWTNYPQFQFLAYYQVLEYFFIKIADEQLYTKITRRVNDLGFRCVPEQLDRLIQDVTDHRRESDETEMLKSVLKKYVREDDLVTFLREYEEEIGTPQYSKKRTLFGTDVQITFNPEYVFAGTAKVIKTIRNALVHSSDRYERAERYVPFSGSEELIAAEIPLIKFLAEKVIVASATPIS